MSFTGSSATGTEVMEACAKNLIPLHLELGGKSPQMVLRDAALDRAVPAIVRSIALEQRAGLRRRLADARRSAGSANRSSAHRRGFAQGGVGPWYEQADMGPLISATQEQRVLGYIASGARGGRARSSPAAGNSSGEEIRPRILRRRRPCSTGVTPEMRIAQEEIFGPVLSAIESTTGRGARRSPTARRTGSPRPSGLATSARRSGSLGGSRQGKCTINAPTPSGAIGAPFGGYGRAASAGRTASTRFSSTPGEERDHRRAGVSRGDLARRQGRARHRAPVRTSAAGSRSRSRATARKVACNDLDAGRRGRVRAPDRAPRRRGDGDPRRRHRARPTSSATSARCSTAGAGSTS